MNSKVNKLIVLLDLKSYNIAHRYRSTQESTIKISWFVICFVGCFLTHCWSCTGVPKPEYKTISYCFIDWSPIDNHIRLIMIKMIERMTDIKPNTKTTIKLRACVSEQCLQPPSVENGVIVNPKPSYVSGDVIRYRCNEYMIAVGSVDSLCRSDGTWSLNIKSGNLPICCESS